MIKFLAILNLIQFTLCQYQQKPLPSPSFGRIFNNSFKTRNFDYSLSACTNPASYGFIQRAGTTKYYAIADLQMNWIDGENYCQSFGAHLPVASSANDTNFFRWFVGGKFMNPSYRWFNNGFQFLSYSGYWLGLFKSLESNSWRWIDDTPLNYVDWDQQLHQPDEYNGDHFTLDFYDIVNKKHTGWHDWSMFIYNIVLCELKC